MIRRTVFACLLLALAACGGPKGTPQASMEAYLKCIAAKDWDCMFGLVPPDMRGKKKALYARWKEDYGPLLTYKWRILQTSVGGDYATVQLYESYDLKGIDARDIRSFKDQYNSFGLKKIDGKWYVMPVGTEKVQAF